MICLEAKCFETFEIAVTKQFKNALHNSSNLGVMRNTADMNV